MEPVAVKGIEASCLECRKLIWARTPEELSKYLQLHQDIIHN